MTNYRLRFTVELDNGWTFTGLPALLIMIAYSPVLLLKKLAGQRIWQHRVYAPGSCFADRDDYVDLHGGGYM